MEGNTAGDNQDKTRSIGEYGGYGKTSPETEVDDNTNEDIRGAGRGG